MNGLLITLHVIISIFLVAVILAQPSTKSGLGSSFGGGSVINSAFGAKGPVSFFMKLTYWFAAGIMVTSLALEIFITKNSKSILDRSVTPLVSQEDTDNTKKVVDSTMNSSSDHEK